MGTKSEHVHRKRKLLFLRLYAGRHQADGLQKDILCPFSGTRALPEWSIFMTLSTTPTCMNSNKNTRSRQRHEGRATGWRRQWRSPKRTKKRGKRDGKRTSGRGGLICNMTKSERLSRKYFRICSWNCASASRREPDNFLRTICSRTICTRQFVSGQFCTWDNLYPDYLYRWTVRNPPKKIEKCLAAGGCENCSDLQWTVLTQSKLSCFQWLCEFKFNCVNSPFNSKVGSSQPSNKMEFVESEKGNIKLLYEGFSYHKMRTLANGAISWMCKKRPDCKVRIKTCGKLSLSLSVRVF